MIFVVITFRTECVHNAADRIQTVLCSERLDGISCLRCSPRAQRVLWLLLGLNALNRDEADDQLTKNRVILPLAPSL